LHWVEGLSLRESVINAIKHGETAARARARNEFNYPGRWGAGLRDLRPRRRCGFDPSTLADRAGKPPQVEWSRHPPDAAMDEMTYRAAADGTNGQKA
jgi:hypothetical protein